MVHVAPLPPQVQSPPHVNPRAPSRARQRELEEASWGWTGFSSSSRLPSPPLPTMEGLLWLWFGLGVVGSEGSPLATVAWHHDQGLLAEFDGILVTQRPGTELPRGTVGIRKGNASLLLHRVALGDLGLYRCTVNMGGQQGEASILLEAAGTHLQIYTEPSSRAAIGSPSLLKCRFSIGDVIELNSLRVNWVAPGGYTVTQFPPGPKENEEGPGGSSALGAISEEELHLGNASLILRVRPGDEGPYTCTVGYRNEERHSETLVSVFAAPHLSLPSVQGSLEEKILLLCQVLGFYPAEGLRAQWLRDEQELPGALIERPRLNSNGTFDLKLTLPLTLQSRDLGASFVCRVDHPALEQPLHQTLQIKIQKGEWQRANQNPSGTSFGIILIILLAITLLAIAVTHRWSRWRERGASQFQLPPFPSLDLEVEQRETRTAADGQDREQPLTKIGPQLSGRAWKMEGQFPKGEEESEGKPPSEERFRSNEGQIVGEDRETEEQTSGWAGPEGQEVGGESVQVIGNHGGELKDQAMESNRKGTEGQGVGEGEGDNEGLAKRDSKGGLEGQITLDSGSETEGQLMGENEGPVMGCSGERVEGQITGGDREGDGGGTVEPLVGCDRRDDGALELGDNRGQMKHQRAGKAGGIEGRGLGEDGEGNEGPIGGSGGAMQRAVGEEGDEGQVSGENEGGCKEEVVREPERVTLEQEVGESEGQVEREMEGHILKQDGGGTEEQNAKGSGEEEAQSTSAEGRLG
ncbi:uncharacterized protein LOC103169650 isoform X2 [Ornithorhynchus anatinus]|uniref:uncharacterized protein LOC103169650 isoform X2 n=1 Tax=Ornithorhynchus anatinus TaxID=9258 RepID=UPI0010A7748B|nr:uncharacterized protein LOC103169650 isoform X2 [Ornithorhynchus anatinus]